MAGLHQERMHTVVPERVGLASPDRPTRRLLRERCHGTFTLLRHHVKQGVDQIAEELCS